MLRAVKAMSSSRWTSTKQLLLGASICLGWSLCSAAGALAQSQVLNLSDEGQTGASETRVIENTRISEPVDDDLEFAPGSTGPINVPLMELHRKGKSLGEDWSKTVTPQAPEKNAFSGIDFKSLRERALNNPRVRALLDAGDQETGPNGEGAERYEGGRLFLLASFSITRISLRSMLEEAKLYGIPVIFRGFKNNSVYETQDAIIEVFGSLEDAEGFVIDPTVFKRFRVASVPQLIGAASSLDQCETPGCADDPVPPRDVVRGNVPLKFALELMARRGEYAAQAAQDALSSAKVINAGAGQ